MIADGEEISDAVALDFDHLGLTGHRFGGEDGSDRGPAPATGLENGRLVIRRIPCDQGARGRDRRRIQSLDHALLPIVQPLARDRVRPLPAGRVVEGLGERQGQEAGQGQRSPRVQLTQPRPQGRQGRLERASLTAGLDQPDDLAELAVIDRIEQAGERAAGIMKRAQGLGAGERAQPGGARSSTGSWCCRAVTGPPKRPLGKL